MNDDDRHPNQSPSPWKVMKYVGGGLSVTGFLLFFSVFISGALNFGNFDDFESRTRSMSIRAVLGMFLIIGGGVLGGIAAKKGNLAGDETGPSNDGTWKFGSDEELAGPIKIRCQKCRALNDETAKFCDQCGADL